MRKIRACLFSSLDGVVDSPQDWHFPFQDAEMTEAIRADMMSSDAMLLGRRTYEEWASYWPNQPDDVPMAKHFNAVRKYVVSTTLTEVGWQNSTLVDGDLFASIEDIKRRPGDVILMSGSGTLVTCLLEAGLVDELRLLVHPIVVGRHKRLFHDGERSRTLKLVESRTLGSGVMHLSYEPVNG